MDSDLRRNGSGYNDPTAYEAIKRYDPEEARYRRFLAVILNICIIAGFKIEGPFVVSDRRTGKVWRKE